MRIAKIVGIIVGFTDRHLRAAIITAASRKKRFEFIQHGPAHIIAAILFQAIHPRTHLRIIPTA